MFSLLSPRGWGGWGGGANHGPLTARSVPRVGILIVRHIPRKINMATIFDNEEGLEINLVPKAFPSPGSAGKALGTRLPKNNSAILENTRKAFICKRWLNER